MNEISSSSNWGEMTCLWRMRPWRMSRFFFFFLDDLDLSSRVNVVPVCFSFLMGGDSDDDDGLDAAVDFGMMLLLCAW